MSNAIPAVRDLLISRRSGFEQELQLFAAELPLQLEGYRFYAQLWDPQRQQRYVSLQVPVTQAVDGLVTLAMSEAVAQGIVTAADSTLGGSASSTGSGEGLDGGTAETTGVILSGGKAWLGVLPDVTAWDLLMVEPGGLARVLLRGSATLTD